MGLEKLQCVPPPRVAAFSDDVLKPKGQIKAAFAAIRDEIKRFTHAFVEQHQIGV